jgi:threonine aldolase
MTTYKFEKMVYRDGTWTYHILCDTGTKWDELKDIVGVDAMLLAAKKIRSYYTDAVVVVAKDRQQDAELFNKYVKASGDGQ